MNDHGLSEPTGVLVTWLRIHHAPYACGVPVKYASAFETASTLSFPRSERWDALSAGLFVGLRLNSDDVGGAN